VNILVKLLGLNPEEYNQWEIRWAQEELEAIAAALALVVPLALWFFWTSLSRVKSGPKKAILFSLRLMVFLLLLLLLLQPELALQKSHTLKNSIAVLLDNSKSLSIQTFPDEKPRIDLVRQVLEREQEYFQKLRESYNVDFYFASDRVAPVLTDAVLKAYRPTGIFTDFDAAFSELHDRYQGKSLQGVMFFSDGGDLTQESENMSQSLLKTLSRFNGPIHTFQTGGNQMFKDLAIESLDAPDFGFAHQPVNLSVTVTASAMGNKKIPLVLKEGDNVIVSKIVEIREEESHFKVDLQFTPRKLGQRIYTLSLPLFAGESITSNNRKDFQVKVVRDRIRVLHLNGRPSWDARFLREFAQPVR